MLDGARSIFKDAVVQRCIVHLTRNAKKIEEYIRNQLKEDLEYDQMTLKENIDPFTGEPVEKGR